MSDAARDPTERTGIAGGCLATTTPTSGIGGAVPAISALTLRLWLAVFGLVICTTFAIWSYLINAPIGFVVVLLALAAVAVIDIVVILRRKRRGEPG